MTNPPTAPGTALYIDRQGTPQQFGRHLGLIRGKGAGSSALQINNKILAMFSSKGTFIVTLSKQRVDALAASGDGNRFDPAHGRLMKEWLAVEATSHEDWLSTGERGNGVCGLETQSVSQATPTGVGRVARRQLLISLPLVATPLRFTLRPKRTAPSVVLPYG